MITFTDYETVPPIENNFPVKVRTFSSDGILRPHWHEHIELLYFLGGEGDVTCNDATYRVKQGDLIVVNSTQMHTFTPITTLSFCCVILYPLFFADICYDSRILISNYISNDSFVEKTMNSILEETSGNKPGADMMIKSHAYKLMAYLFRNYTLGRLSEKETNVHKSKLEKADVLLYYISKHYGEKLTSEILSGICYMNQSHFCRFFKKTFGKTPTAYINEYRVEKACGLLSETTLSIAEISASVGFDDLNYFSRTFKKIKNVTPTDFRRLRS